MKVSIITVVYNNKNTIEDCLQSVRNQTYPSIEHIIIDGGSTDGTVEVIGKYRDGIAYS
jgi:Glycosyltransferases involved in cell wall biogenesis